jgi:hypothetical protein
MGEKELEKLDIQTELISGSETLAESFNYLSHRMVFRESRGSHNVAGCHLRCNTQASCHNRPRPCLGNHYFRAE